MKESAQVRPDWCWVTHVLVHGAQSELNCGNTVRTPSVLYATSVMHMKTMQGQKLSVQRAGSKLSSFQQWHFHPPSSNTGQASLSVGIFSQWLHLSEGSAAKDRSRHSFPREILKPSFSVPTSCRTTSACWHGATGMIWCKQKGEAAWYWDLSYWQHAMGDRTLSEDKS